MTTKIYQIGIGFVILVIAMVASSVFTSIARAATVSVDNTQTIVAGDIGAAFQLGNTVYYKDEGGVWHGLDAPTTGDYTITVGNVSWYKDASGTWYRHGLLNADAS